MIALIILVANQIAIQCLGTECSELSYPIVQGLIAAGTIELIYEIRGFIKVYAKKNKIDKK